MTAHYTAQDAVCVRPWFIRPTCSKVAAGTTGAGAHCGATAALPPACPALACCGLAGPGLGRAPRGQMSPSASVAGHDWAATRPAERWRGDSQLPPAVPLRPVACTLWSAPPANRGEQTRSVPRCLLCCAQPWHGDGGMGAVGLHCTCAAPCCSMCCNASSRRWRPSTWMWQYAQTGAITARVMHHVHAGLTLLNHHPRAARNCGHAVRQCQHQSCHPPLWPCRVAPPPRGPSAHGMRAGGC